MGIKEKVLQNKKQTKNTVQGEKQALFQSSEDIDGLVNSTTES